MARTPKRLSGPTQLTNAAVTKYTVPALTKTIIRHIAVSNPSGSPVTFTMSIGADAAATRLYDAFSIPAAAAGVTESNKSWWVYYVMDAAEILQALAGTTLVLVLTVDGEEITLG
jgi:hypothetical protein